MNNRPFSFSVRLYGLFERHIFLYFCFITRPFLSKAKVHGVGVFVADFDAFSDGLNTPFMILLDVFLHKRSRFFLLSFLLFKAFPPLLEINRVDPILTILRLKHAVKRPFLIK